MKVYRIEHKDKKHPHSKHYRGPYYSKGVIHCYAFNSKFGKLDEDVAIDIIDAMEHCLPTPSGDGLLIREGIDICGFTSLDMLLEWFPDAEGRSAMGVEKGFTLREYVVPCDAVNIGNYQCLFDRRKIAASKELDITTLWVPDL